MSATTLGPVSAPRHAAARRAGRAARRRAYLAEAAALSFGALLVVWTVIPLYNMVLVSLESHGDVFTDSVWPPHPSFASF